MTSLHRILFFLFVAFSSASVHVSAQSNTFKTDKAIFYEISGNGLRMPSYLFGTMHLLTQQYVDSLPMVMDYYGKCTQVAGEMILDSSTSLKMLPATMLKGQTLKEVLPDDLYSATNNWLKELSGYDLALFNALNPMTINVTLLQLVQAKYYPVPSGAVLMDNYFQQRAKKEHKEVIGLENVEEQVNALFNQFSIERQTELLKQFVKEKDKSISDLGKMTKLYRTQQLDALEKLMYDETYTQAEIEVLLYKRNEKWVEQLPVLMMRAPTFIAVGALHLAGERGLVNLLRQKGYTVTPYYF
jgi:uncharacterized protein YbaP (TraB family)